MIIAKTTTSLYSTVTATAAAIASTIADNVRYVFASSTNCFIKQGTSLLVTCMTEANATDGDYFTLTIDGAATIYEFDKAGDGVTSGRVQVNISADTTAATVAARLRTTILANQTQLSVTDNTDGTLTVVAPELRMTSSENVSHASFTIANAVCAPTAASGSMYVPAGLQVFLDGRSGPQVGVLRDTADGKATLTRFGSTA